MKELSMYELTMMVCGSTYMGRGAEISIYRDGLFRVEIRYRSENGSVIHRIDGSGGDISACFKQCLDKMNDDCNICLGDTSASSDGVVVGCGMWSGCVLRRSRRLSGAIRYIYVLRRLFNHPS